MRLLRGPARRRGRRGESASADWPTRIAGIVLLLVLASVQFWDPPLVEAARLRVFDQLQRWFPKPVPEETPVVIVDIDDASLAEIGQWPWPRTVFVDLIDRLREQGAAAVVFDVLFAEADRLSPPLLAPLIERTSPRAAAVLRTLPSNEQAFAEALQRLPAVLGEAGTITAHGRLQGGVTPPAKVAWLGGDTRPLLPTYPHGISALPMLAAAAAGLGVVSITPEVDGVVRRAPTLATIGGRTMPSLAFETVRLAAGAETVVVHGDEYGIVAVQVGALRVPTDRDGRVWLHFTPRRSELYLSFQEVLTGSAPPDRLAGQIVLVGSSAVSLGDIRVTPVAGNTPGVEVQAQLVESFLDGTLLQRPAALVNAEQLTVLVGGLLLAWFGMRLPAAVFPGLVAIVLALAAAITLLGLVRLRLLIDAVYPAFAFGLLLFWLAMAKYIREESRRRSLRDAFGHYLAPVMVDRLVGNPSALTLSGERKVLTVLFSDIRGFTGLTERYAADPEGMTALLNRYFTAMTEEILEHEGTIDKYIGDAIMAFWNAPLDDPDHPRHACAAALAMMRRLDELNAALATEFTARGETFVPLRIGIGLEMGASFVGNLGSAQRFNYSVIGDSVNVAARLESSSKVYGFPIIVGEGVRSACADWAFLRLDTVQLRGRQQATGVFALLGGPDVAADPRWAELEAAYAAAGGAPGAAADPRCAELAHALGAGGLFAVSRSDDRVADEAPLLPAI
jgi:adenylate cyclase